jgi:signal transduction histidine kinase
MPPPPDPRWPKLLSLSVHEFRTPITVVAGYLRMLLKDRAGALNDQQRRLLEEAEKSCARLSALLAEVSDLSNLEAGTSPANRQGADLNAVLKEAIDQLPDLPDRTVHVELRTEGGAAPVSADSARLGLALGSIVTALRRELVTSDRLQVRVRRRGWEHEILIGDDETLRVLEQAPDGALPVFDEWRGGCGLTLPIARRILDAHGGHVWSAPEGHKSGARITLPAA